LNEILTISLLSIKVAFIATVFVVPLGSITAWWLSFSKSNLRPLVEVIVLIPMVLPPVALGLILLHCLSTQSFLGNIWYKIVGSQILLSWYAAVVASFVVGFPLFVKAAQTAMLQIPMRYINVARTMGKTKLQIFRFIILPMASKGILNGSVLAFARGLGEFGATVLVAGIIPGHTETLALGIYDRIVNGQDSEAWPLVYVSILISAIAIALSLFLQKAGRQNGDLI